MGDSYKLTYFDIKGIAEVSRLLFVISGTPFEDFRFPFDDDRTEWKAAKHTFPMFKIPDLAFNGTHISQSKAIERFLAKKFGFFGSNEVEAAQIDSFSEEIRDIVIDYRSAVGNDEKMTKFWSEEYQTHLDALVNVSGKNGHFVGDKLSLADIQFFHLTTNSEPKYLAIVEAELEKRPVLTKIRDTVAANDKLIEYLSKRKVTPF